MTGFVAICIALAVVCFKVEGIRIDPSIVLPRGKYFPSSRAPYVTVDDPRCTKDGLFANPDDCTSYYVCRNGQSQDRTCPEGLKFDSYKHCTFDKDADCGIPSTLKPIFGSAHSIVCPEAYGMFKFPGDCNKYITCTLGKSQIEQCPEHQVYQDNVGCVDGDDCPEDPDSVCKKSDELYPVPGDCHKYIKCVNGKPQEKRCAPGQGFDRKKMQCTKLQNARCRSNEIHEIMDI